MPREKGRVGRLAEEVPCDALLQALQVQARILESSRAPLPPPESSPEIKNEEKSHTQHQHLQSSERILIYIYFFFDIQLSHTAIAQCPLSFIHYLRVRLIKSM